MKDTNTAEAFQPIRKKVIAISPDVAKVNRSERHEQVISNRRRVNTQLHNIAKFGVLEDEDGPDVEIRDIWEDDEIN